MKFEQPHQLAKDEAKRRLTLLLEHWQSRYGMNVTWDGDSAKVIGKVKGIDFDAGLTVADASVRAEGTDPGLLLRAAATAYLKKKLAAYLDPAKSAEDIKQLYT